MIHPLLRLVATRPQLLADHAEAYAGLVGQEWGATAASWKQRVLLGAVALCLFGVAVVLGGVALMFWAVTPSANIQLPWALAAAPLVPALAALACGWWAQRASQPGFAELKRQIACDLALLREVSTAASTAASAA